MATLEDVLKAWDKKYPHFSIMKKSISTITAILCLSQFLSCTSDTEPPPPLQGNYSSAEQPSSNSNVPISSSSLPTGKILCLYSGGCTAIATEDCPAIGGQVVQSCPAVSSSSLRSSSSSLSLAQSSSSFSGTIDTFTDSRDGKVYKKVTIGSQTWMAENLKYYCDGSKCPYNDPAYCTYGRLYNWYTAMEACPSGWHLPSNEEWWDLSLHIEYSEGCRGCDGKHLKATSGWEKCGISMGNGEDTYGFSALPESPSIYSCDVSWWSSTRDYFDSGEAVSSSISGNGDMGVPSYNKNSFLSVRCLQD